MKIRALVKFVQTHTLIIVALVLPIVLLLFWVKPGFMLAKAEEGIPFYNPEKTFNLYVNPLNEVGLGFGHALFLPRATLLGLVMVLHRIGVESWTIQLLVFYLLTVTPLIAMTLLVNRLFPSVKPSIGFLSGLFYVFNLYSLSQVFGRFLYPLIFTWSFLPLFLFLWVSFIDDGKSKHFIYLILASVVFSTSFGMAASIITILTPALLYTLLKVLKREETISSLVRTGLVVLGWFVTNLWWVLPLIKLRDTSYSIALQPHASIESLGGVSKYFPSREIFLLKQLYLFGPRNYLSELYLNNNNEIVGLVIFFIVILGLVGNRKRMKWIYLTILLVFGWFVVKGANPPLGIEIYSYLYNNFSVSQVLRNPYEKFGSVYLLAYSIFFAFGFNWILVNFKKYSLITSVGLPLFVLVYLPFPIWNATVFGKDTYIKVPDYYISANRFLNDNSEGRILHVPFLFGSGVKYSWGYNGEEPSDYLFDRPSVSRSLSLSQYDDFYRLLGSSVRHKNFTKLLSITNIGGVVNHNDIIVDASYNENFSGSRNILKTLSGLEFENTYGQLEVYKLDSKLYQDRVYVAQRILRVSDLKEGVSKILEDNFDPKNDVVVVREQNVFENFAHSEDYEKPEITVVKDNPGRYRISVTESVGTYILVLANNFDSHWVAKIDGIKQNTHFEVNGFANGWIIDKKGTYNIDLIYIAYPWQ